MEAGWVLGYEEGGGDGSTEEADQLWAVLDGDPRDVHLEPLTSGEDGYRSVTAAYTMLLAALTLR